MYPPPRLSETKLLKYFAPPHPHFNERNGSGVLIKCGGGEGVKVFWEFLISGGEEGVGLFDK